MKKKKLKNLSLNKIKVSKIDTSKEIVGATTAPCIFTITKMSELFCSEIINTCGCPPDPIVDPDNSRGCPSWNVAC